MNVTAEELAKLFYYYRDALAPDFGFQSSEGSLPWEQILPEHRNLMIASARLVLLDLAERQDMADQDPAIPLDWLSRNPMIRLAGCS